MRAGTGWTLNSSDYEGITTFKCEGCGRRLPSEQRYMLLNTQQLTVCSAQCMRGATRGLEAKSTLRRYNGMALTDVFESIMRGVRERLGHTP